MNKAEEGVFFFCPVMLNLSIMLAPEPAGVEE
jgi:hypothetical protein